MSKAAVAPQRPQRKADQKSAGLLVEVVRTLTTSPSQAQKELQRERLEKDYAITSHNIDRLLTDHQQDLTSSLQSFRKVSVKLATSRERVRSLKNNLSSCKSLLQCKRDELKQLWFESAEQNRVVKLLSLIESVKLVPRQVDDALAKKHFLLGSKLLMDAHYNIGENLNDVDGMIEIRDNVELRLKNIFDQILRELDRQIYIKPLEELLFELKRVNSMRKSSGSHLIAAENETIAASSADETNTVRPKSSSSSRLSLPASLKSLNNVYSQLSEDESPILMDDGLAYEDNSPGYNPENNYVQYIAILLESLGVIGRLSQGVDSIKESIPRGLSKLTQHIAVFVHEHYSSSEQSSDDNRLLVELLHLLIRQFKSISLIHGYVINQIKRVQSNCLLQRDKDLTCYQNQDLWIGVQSCLKHLLNDYLDVNNSEYADGVLKSRSVFDSSLKIDDWSKYFTRKRLQKNLKPTYFRFTHTANAIESKAYNIERRLLNFDDSPTTVKHNFYKLTSAESHPSSSSITVSSEDRFYVCRPDPENVTIIFKPLMRFIVEIESRDTSYGSCCPLRSFIEDFTRDVYLPKIRADTDRRLDAFLGHSDSWEQLASPEEFIESGEIMGSFRQRIPILSCVLRVYTLCKNFESLAQSAPAFLEPVAQLWLGTLWRVVESAEIAYEASTGSSLASSGEKIPSNFRPSSKRKQSIVFPAHEKRKVSASWAVDEDISRLLKSLPNWFELLNSSQRQSIDESISSNGYERSNQRRSRSPDTIDSAPTPLSTHSASFDASVQEIRSRNQRESELLISNLGTQKRIDENEVILDDFGRLRCVANMHESLEWLSKQTKRSLSQMSPSTIVKLKEIPITIINEITQQQLFTNLHQEMCRSIDALQDTANTCLLMLHLEIRVHCFYYVLDTLHNQYNSSTNPVVGGGISKLNKNLVQFHELCTLNLQKRKVNYIFEGLGHLLSSIFINCCQNIQKLNDQGKIRLANDLLDIKKCLSNLTRNAEPDLELARQFFALLNKNTPEEILEDILRKTGPKFKELDYQNLLALFVRSRPSYGNEPGTLDKYSARLREIMADKRRHD